MIHLPTPSPTASDTQEGTGAQRTDHWVAVGVTGRQGKGKADSKRGGKYCWISKNDKSTPPPPPPLERKFTVSWTTSHIEKERPGKHTFQFTGQAILALYRPLPTLCFNKVYFQ